jgi:alkanesulfonate monooxygenase SsuD/methylene tetrahydromethanopterin reductase-like flavin-dependent oxidoreductase (luciferase family)
MEIGIGLPSTIPGVEPSLVLRWAAEAEERGFASVGVVDRLVYSNLDPMTMLAAVAVVTTGVRLVTGVLISPLRSNAPAFAKQAATIDRLSNGRLVLGLGVGNRPDDYEIAGLDFHHRGQAFDAQLEEITAIWQGENPRLGPEPYQPGGPQLLFGGISPATFRRIARYGTGWLATASSAEVFAERRDAVTAVWDAAGRSGQPRLVAHSYAGVGPGALGVANAYFRDYYAHRLADMDALLGAALLSQDAVSEHAEQLAAVGCDEFIMTPLDPDPSQVHLLADAAGL